MALEDRGQRRLLDHGRPGPGSPAGGGDEALLQLPQARGRVVGEFERAVVVVDQDQPRAGDQLLGRGFQGTEVGALGQAVGDRRDHLAAVEVGVALLEVGHRLVEIVGADRARIAATDLGDHPVDRLRRQLELGRARDPLGPLAVGVHTVVLGFARAVGGDFGRRRRFDPVLGHRREDLRPAAGEVLDHGAIDPLQVGPAVVGLLPGEAERPRDARAQRRLVDVASRFGLKPKRRPALRRGEAEPAPVGERAGHVGGDQVGVQGGVAGARGAVAEGS